MGGLGIVVLGIGGFMDGGGSLEWWGYSAEGVWGWWGSGFGRVQE